jgi:hypothetical protein
VVSRKGNIAIILVIVLIVFSLIGVLYLYLQEHQVESKSVIKNQESSRLVLSPTPGSTPPPSELIDKISKTPTPQTNWKTYINTKYSYEVRYPPDWQIGPADSAVTNLETASSVNLRVLSDQTPAISGFTIGVTADPQGLTLSQMCSSGSQDFLCQQNVNHSQEQIGHLIWEKLDNNAVSLPPSGYVLYDTANNRHLYYLYMYNADEGMVLQILSTFKFL